MRSADSDDSTALPTAGATHRDSAKARQSRRRRALFVTLIGVFLCGVVLAGKARSGEPSPDEEQATRAFRVRVVEEDHPDRGVPNARVNIWHIARVAAGGGMPPSDNLPNVRAKTDTDGRVAIQRIVRNRAGARRVRWPDDRGLYLQVTASGFTLARRTIPAAVWAKTDVVVALARGTVVAGKVRRADGTAAKGVHVRGTQPEQWGWVQDSHEAVTDGLGAFRLSGFFPGSVSLHATLNDGDAVWVCDTTAEAGSGNADIRLPAEPTRRRIRLLVKGADGLQVASARWYAEDGLYIPWSRASSQGQVENGAFILPADPDVQYVTIAYPRDKDRKDLPWATTVVGPLGSRGGDLEVVMPRGVTVSGTVRDEQGKPLHDILVFARPLIPEGRTERAVWKGWLDSLSDWEGRFQIERVPRGRVEVDPYKGGWSAEPVRVSVPTGPLDFVMLRQPRLQGCVRHPDGTPAPEAAVYAQGADAEGKGWARVYVKRDGTFSVYHYDPGAIRLRAGLSPSGVEDMAASEVTAKAGEDAEAIVLTVPRGRSLLVRIPGWPASVAGAARLANGPYSRGHSEWILGDTASFEGIDPRAPLSFYCGPLPDGRIAFSRDVSATSAQVSLPLVPSRSIRGRARGFPSDAQPERVWADTSAFKAPGRVGPDGAFLVRGVPPGACRVCIVFKRGDEVWAGSVHDTVSADPVEVKVRRMDETAFAAWLVARPPP